MSAAVVASVTPSNLLKGVKGLSKNQFWQASIGNGNCPDVALSLASSCPIEVESSTNSTEPTVSKAISERRKHEMTMDLMTSESMEEKQEDEVGSACMTEEDLNSPPTFGKSISFLDWSMNGTKNMKAGDGLERMGSGISVVSGGSGSLLVDSENIVGEDSKKFVMVEQGKLPSSQYKGVVPQPNGRWGAQIYEKHQRVWLGTFNREEDAAKAYDRAALKFRGRDAMTNFVPVSETDPEAAFLREHSKGEIVDMLRKHTYEEELDQSKQMMSIIRPAKTPEGSDKPNSDPKVAGSKPAEPREHLFDKAVTPSDVGKLNRLVIPKQHAEKYFPLDVNTSGKGLLLNFEDDTQKTWRFRYSYWNSSQSYVLTKGWSRFVKEKKLVAGDIVSFQKAAQQLHISFRRRPCNPASDMPAKPSGFGLITTRSPQMNIFKSEGNMVAGYPQWMQLFWPGNSALYNNPGCAQLGSVMQPINQGSSLSKTNGHDTEIWAQSSCSSLYLNDPTVYLSSNKQAHNTNPKNSMSDDRHSSLDFVKLQGPGAGIPSKSNKIIACSENTVRLFGVNLKDQSASPLNLFPTHLYSDESSKGLNKRKASIQLLSGLFSVNTQDNSSLEECSKKQCLENVL